MRKPILVELIAYAPTAFYHCMHCEVAFREMGKSDQAQLEQLQSSLPDDLMGAYAEVSEWVRNMFRIHGEGLVIKVIDAASVEGVFKSLRHATRRFPAVILDGHTALTGTDALSRAAEEIHQQRSAALQAGMPG